jgi:Meiotically Up-regulated Gene 113 (MUG113) protein
MSSMSKKFIIEKIKELASTGGVPGFQKFSKYTGVTRYEMNKHWETWSQAIQEAGFEPNQVPKIITKEDIIVPLIAFIREKDNIPSNAAIRNRRYNNPEFPAYSTIFRRFKNKTDLITETANYCKKTEDYNDILGICKNWEQKNRNKVDKQLTLETVGYVYLIKFNDYYKIGRSNDIDRRFGEIKTKLPEKQELIHVIKTDDTQGIEKYWHQRFSQKRKGGEWFKLDNKDVAAFKKRKVM